MLKTRLLTAALMVPLFIAALYLLDSRWFAALTGIVMLLGLLEWTQFLGQRGLAIKILYVALGLAAGLAVLISVPLDATLFLPVVLLWCIVAIRIWRCACRQVMTTASAKGPAVPGWLAWFDGYFVLVPTWLGLLYLHHQDPDSPQKLLIFFLLIWAADSGAYVVGRALGKRKLAPSISPGKTVAGLFGGLAGALLVALISALWLWQLPGGLLLFWLAAVLVVALFSVVGDLFESVYKRAAGIKDSGTLIPGHGGVLDRIDSISAALPSYLVSLQVFGLLPANGSLL